jgi:hypothetical protein
MLNCLVSLRARESEAARQTLTRGDRDGRCDFRANGIVGVDEVGAIQDVGLCHWI